MDGDVREVPELYELLPETDVARLLNMPVDWACPSDANHNQPHPATAITANWRNMAIPTARAERKTAQGR